MTSKTIPLSGEEIKVEYSGGANAWLRNDGAAAVYASAAAGITPGADGVIEIPSGGGMPVYGANGTVYLLGSGKVHLVGSDYSTSPFVRASLGGEAGVNTNAAQAVELDGLQEGVPFSEILLDGDIVGQEITLRACGKNLISKPYSSDPGERGGIDFAVNGDGSITMNGTATSNAFFKFTDIGGEFPVGTYTISGYISPTIYAYVNIYGADGTKKAIYSAAENGTTFTIDEPASFSVMLVVNTDTVCDNVTVFPQLERGSSATTFEPYSGSEIKVTPNQAPYSVPNDIRQQDGINNIMVSAGTVQVTGARRNLALKKVWDKLDELTAAVIVSNGE